MRGKVSICVLVLLFVLSACSTGPATSQNASVSVSVQSGTVDVDVSGSFSATFTAPVLASSVHSQSFYVVPQSSSSSINSNLDLAITSTDCLTADPMTGTISCANDALSCTLSMTSSLSYETEYTLCLTSAIEFQNPNLNGAFDGVSVDFTTQGQPDSEGPTPGVVTISNEAGTSLSLSWSAASDDYSSAADLRYKVVIASSEASIDTIAEADAIENSNRLMDWTAASTSLNVSDLSEGETYYFAVLVKDEQGNNALYDVVSQTMSDNTSPTAGNGGSAGSVTSSSLSLSWNASTDNVTQASALEYKVVQATSSTSIDTLSEADAISGSNRILNWTSNTTSLNVSSLSPSTTYYFAILVRDAAGNKSLYSLTNATTVADETAPTAGTAISFSNTNAFGTTVSWGAASDTVTATASLQYKLVKASASTSIDTVSEADAITGDDLILNWAANTLTDYVGLPDGASDYFAVLVKDEAGNKTLYTPQQSDIPNTNELGLVGLSDGNFMVLYRDTDDSNKGKSVIFDDNGDWVAGPEEVVSGGINIAVNSWSNIRGIQHSNGDVVFVYNDGNSDGAYVVLDSSTGELLNSPVVFESSGSWFNDVTEVGSSDLIFIGNGLLNATQSANVYLYDLADDGLDSSGVLHAGTSGGGEIRGMRTCTFGNDSALAVYSYSWNNYYAKYQIYNSSLSATTSATWLKGSTTQSHTYDCTTLTNGDIMVVYEDMADSNKGKVVVISDDGTLSLSETTWYSSTISSGSLEAVEVAADDILVVYRDNSDTKIYYTFLDNDGVVTSGPTELYGAGTSYPQIVDLGSGLIGLAYYDGTGYRIDTLDTN